MIKVSKNLKEMEEVYRELGIDHSLIIRLKEGVTENIVLDLFARLENVNKTEGAFFIVARYPETKLKRKK